MHVRNYMTTKLSTVRFDKKMIAIRELMEWAHVRHVPVVDHEGGLVGILSHRDLLRASISNCVEGASLAEERLQLAAIPIKKVMRTDVVTIAPDASIQEAAALMLKKNVGALPVVERGRLVGILSEADLLRLLVELPV